MTRDSGLTSRGGWESWIAPLCLALTLTACGGSAELIGGLSEKERAAFLMRHYHGCSIEEIGSTLGMKTNATKHSIFRAVKKMRVAMQGLMRTTE